MARPPDSVATCTGAHGGKWRLVMTVPSGANCQTLASWLKAIVPTVMNLPSALMSSAEIACAGRKRPCAVALGNLRLHRERSDLHVLNSRRSDRAACKALREDEGGDRTESQ